MIILGITLRQAFKYAIFPEIIPRFQDLFSSGFQYIPYLIALVYQSVRLLPPNHPYTMESNMGRFGVRHVIAEAANNLVISRQNIDQIILFFTIIAGFLMTVIQLALLAASLISQPVMAAIPEGFSGFFVTANPAQDIAHMMMDMVFGVPDVFNSCVSRLDLPCVNTAGEPMTRPDGGDWIFAQAVFPFPVHVGLHQMFQIYSTGLLVIATFIAGYFVITVVAETAQTGTAFGKRFNKVWAPIRIVMAFGLLVPVGYGLNSAQYIVLHAAKYGSAFATNGWLLFNEALQEETLISGSQQLVATPNIPEVSSFLQFMHVARTCKYVEKFTHNLEIKPYLVKSPQDKVPSLEVSESAPPSYEQMIEFADKSKYLTITFGVKDEEKFGRYQGFVKPYCGTLKMTLNQPYLTKGGNLTGAEVMQRYYWFIFYEIWYNQHPRMATMPDYAYKTACIRHTGCPDYKDESKVGETKPDSGYAVEMQNIYSEDVRAALNDPGSTGLSGILRTSKGAVEEQINAGGFGVDQNLRDKGWGGAGIWYNKVAELNGAVTSSALNIPKPVHYPFVMEYVREYKKIHEKETSPNSIFDPKLTGGATIDKYKTEATTLYHAYQYFQTNSSSSDNIKPTQNAFTDMINLIFGTEGLYNLRNNPETHPLAGLVGIGRSLIESSIRNIGIAAFGGAVGAAFQGFVGNMGTAAASFFVTVAMMALTVGFILFYVVPFLPFVYFFFAVSGWVKGIFEAMLGAPLWALAHIRIDGEGLPGKAAEGGYYMILEIFLRPILIVFGLLASITIYAALVETLNETMSLVTSNVGGYNMEPSSDKMDLTDIEFYRGPIDEFFYTVLYAIIVYMMGSASFKLIDQIPNKILRWAGNAVQTFGELREDPTEGLVSGMQQGSQQAVGSIGGGLNNLLKGIGGMGKK